MVQTAKDPEGTLAVAKIAKECQAKNELFHDNAFPPTDKSIWRDPSLKGSWLKGKHIEWKRPAEIGDTSAKLAVFASGGRNSTSDISPDDIVQGEVGDCYFLAALSAVATKPDLIDSLIVEEHSKQGVYGVKFFQQGKWQTVIIDDLFPCEHNETTGEWVPVFVKYSEGEKETWMMLAEKAWAKLHGSYQVIANGMVPDTLCYLTGGHRTLYHLNEDEGWKMFSTGDLWTHIYKLFKMSSDTDAVFISSSGVHDDKPAEEIGGLDEAAAETGLVGDHAYTVLDLQEFPDKNRPNGKLQLIKVRNPWGSYEWKGDFGDSSPLWTPDLKKKCGEPVNPINDGSFWMTFQDFGDYFSFIGCCTTHGPSWTFKTLQAEWKIGESAGGRDDDTIQFNPTFVLRNHSKKVVIQVEQGDIRRKEPWDMYFFDIFVNVLKHTTPAKGAIAVDVSHTVTGFHNEDEVHDKDFHPVSFRFHSIERVKSLEMYLEPGEYDILLTRAFRGFGGHATLNVWSDGPFELTQKPLASPGPKEKPLMAQQKLRKTDAITCCMTGTVIDRNNPSSYEVQKGVFWHVQNHPKNYRCAGCMRPFDSAVPFFDIGKEERFDEWKGYCARCFKTTFYPKCLICSKPIYDTPECAKCNGEYVRVAGGRVHAECWVELQLKQTKSNLVCPLTVNHSVLPDDTVAVVCRVKKSEEAIGKLQKLLDS